MNNREIISWNISKNPNYEQVDNMLDITFHKYPNIEGLIFHSDQGWQYQMNQYHKTLHEYEFKTLDELESAMNEYRQN